MGRGRPRVARVQVLCTGCDAILERYPTQVAKNKTSRWFCSTACRDRIGSKPRRKALMHCEWTACGAAFYPRSGQANRFCSRKCKDFAARVGTDRRCLQCSGMFHVRPSEPDKHCSRICYELSRQTPIGKRKVNDDGYVLIYQPNSPEAYTADHSLRGWVLEHRAVIASALGHALSLIHI